MRLSITLISDIICPWCYVGKKRLETAIQELNLTDKIDLDIAPYQLYPDTPVSGKPLKSFGKKGHKTTLTAVGLQAGIEFRWDLIQLVPNTLSMHKQLMQLPSPEIRWRAKSALLDAYFCRGIDLSKEENVSTVLSPYVALMGNHLEYVAEDVLFQEARNRNIAAVPSFILNGKHHITGAMEKQQWAQFLKRKFQLN